MPQRASAGDAECLFVHLFPQFFTGLKVQNIFCRNIGYPACFRIAAFASGFVMKAKAAEAAQFNSVTLGKLATQRIKNALHSQFQVIGGELWI